MTKLVQHFEMSDRLRARAKSLIPGGCHTYAKGDDQYPVLSPGFIASGYGCHVWDVDGNEFIEYGMGNRSVGLGHAYPHVVGAVRRELEFGCNFTRPSKIEVECAATFLKTVPTAEMVKFCKNGSDATSAAIRLSRAVTGRDLIALCSDHPFFSADDWFIGKTAMNAGVPISTQSLAVGYHYNDIESAKELFRLHPGNIAAFILEPSRGDPPRNHFLHELQKLCHENGALFILDEMITGFRWEVGGAQSSYNITPDLSCFGKALGNGFSISALAGRREFMQLGDIEQLAVPRVFLLSTTHGAETHSMAAAIATMHVYSQEPVLEHLRRQGTILGDGLNELAALHGLSDHFQVSGHPCCLSYSTKDGAGKPSQAMRTLFLQETIRRGVLAPSFVVSYTHEEEDVQRTLEAVDGALAVYKMALESDVGNYLVGRPSDVVFRAFNSHVPPPTAAAYGSKADFGAGTAS